MTSPDLFRAVLISVAVFLSGTVSFGAYAAWRDRSLPVPRRAPIRCILIFTAGYVLLLVQFVVDRWEKLGQGVGFSGYLALFALVLNVFAMVSLVRSSLPEPAKSPHPRKQNMPTPHPSPYYGMHNVHNVHNAANAPETPRAPLVEREPALVAGGAGTALVSAFVGLLASFGKLDVQQASAVEAFGYALVMAAPILVAWWTRGRVFAPATLEKAGLEPEHVEEVAADPSRTFVEAP